MYVILIVRANALVSKLPGVNQRVLSQYFLLAPIYYIQVKKYRPIPDILITPFFCKKACNIHYKLQRLRNELERCFAFYFALTVTKDCEHKR